MLASENLKRVKRTAFAFSDRPPNTPAECRVGVVERQIAQSERKALDPNRLQALVTRFQSAAQSGDFAGISKKDWRQLVYILWDGSPPLLESPAIVDRLRALIKSANSTAPLRRLIFSYLSRFDPALPSIAAMGLLILEELRHRQSPRLSSWQTRSSTYGIFLPHDAMRTIPAKLVYADDIGAFERGLGIEGQLTRQGFIVHIWAHVLAHLERSLKAGGPERIDLDGILDALEVAKKLRFVSLRVATANSLLSPWANRPLSDAILQKRLKTFFLDHLGDPYTRRENWHGVNADASLVMRRWLVQENLRIFFELITQASDANEYATGHWKYRRQFWSAFWERGALDEAWMVLGSKIENLAKEKLTPGIGYGRLKGGNDLHAVLLMRVGTLVFAEWSYNGKCRAWATDDRLCPQIGSTNYRTADFQRPSMIIDPRYVNDGISHMNSQAGYWQGILAKFIGDRTRIQVSHREYMP